MATYRKGKILATTNFDRISSLSDGLLRHILSFLPTKLAVATSVLSKRWTHLWLSVPTLDLDDESYVETEESYLRFLRFAYAAIFWRHETQPIQTFRLKCASSSRCAAQSDINTWVNALRQRQVEALELSLPPTINLPSGVFSCASLVVLKLKGLTVNTVFSVVFPSINMLHLEGVHFTRYQHFMKLLSGCPNVEDLQIKSLKLDEYFCREGLSCLHKLVRADISLTYVLLKGICNTHGMIGKPWNSIHSRN